MNQQQIDSAIAFHRNWHRFEYLYCNSLVKWVICQRCGAQMDEIYKSAHDKECKVGTADTT